MKDIGLNTNTFLRFHLFFHFVCCINGGKIKILEHKNIIWDKAEKLNYLDFAEADIPIYNEYLRYIKGE